MDPMKAVMMVKANEAQYAGDQLIDMSEKQQANLDASKKLRTVQEALDKYASDGVIDQDEGLAMNDLMASVDLERGVAPTNGGDIVRNGKWDENEYVYLEANDDAGVDDVDGLEGQKWMDDQLELVDNAIKDQEDEQAKIGIDMQIAVQDYTDANGEEASLSKQLSDLRNKISSKLDG